jgi:hypothetical protein
LTQSLEEEGGEKMEAELASSMAIQNAFKMAQILQLQKKDDDAITQYHEVCSAIAKTIRENPDADVDYRLIPVSINKIVEIYRTRDDYGKMKAFLEVERLFLENLTVTSQDSGSETKGQSHNLLEMLDRMEAAFAVKAKLQPQEIVQMMLEERKEKERESMKRNMETLLQYAEERKRKLENSRWARVCDFFDRHTCAIMIWGMVLVVIITMGVFVWLSTGKSGALDRYAARLKKAGANKKAPTKQRTDTERTESREAAMRKYEELRRKAGL